MAPQRFSKRVGRHHISSVRATVWKVVTSSPSRQPTLSVVIPAFNVASTLERQLEALADSVDDTMEIIVVDNRSTDATRQIAEQFAARNPMVRIVDADARQGEAFARNAGVAAARSDKIAFCDADDQVSPTWALAALAALRTAGYVTGPVDVDLLNPPWLAGVRGRRVFMTMPTSVTGTPFAHGCNMAMTRSTFDAVGGFDEAARIGTDVNFAIRAAAAGVELCWSDDMVIHYRHRSTASGRWHQAIAYGRAASHLCALAGTPWDFRTRLRAQTRRCFWLVRSVPQLYGRQRRAQWCWTLALVVGELLGPER